MKINLDFENTKYNNIVLQRVENKFNMVLPFAAFACLFTSIMVFLSDIPNLFAYINLSVAVIYTTFFIFRNKLHVKVKMYLTITIAFFIGFISFLDGGYTSAFITLFSLANIIAVLFMSAKRSRIIAAFSVILFTILWIHNEFNLIHGPFYLSTIRFSLQYFVFILYLLTLNITVYSVRSYLNDTIVELEESVEKSNKIAYYDSLTNLPNLHHFKLHLNDLNPNKGHIVIINLRNLSVINSIYGDQFGDQVLVRTAEILSSFMSETKALARISGNEFAFYCYLDKAIEIEKKLDAFKDTFNNNFKLQTMNTKVIFTISYASIKESHDFLHCYQNAMLALTYAKNNQLSTYLPYDQRISDLFNLNESIKSNIEPALHNEEFCPHYQEKTNAVTGNVIGVEALARWTSPNLGSISPGTFIPIVESQSLSIHFGEYMIEHVFRDYKRLTKKYHTDLTVSINISPSYLVYSDFAIYALKKKEEYNIPNNKIIFEITEEIMIQDLNLVGPIISDLHKYGFLVALDDFGSGYSSINYLTVLDIDELKIDRSFVVQITDNSKAKIMLEAIIDLANQYHLTLVVEGVETKDQNDILVRMGCHLIQGYYYSVPTPL